MCWLQNMKQSRVSGGGRMIYDSFAEKVGKGTRRTSYTCSHTSRGLQHRTALLGKKTIYQRLCGSFQVDITHIHKLSGSLPLSVNEALGNTAMHFREHQ